MIGPAALYNATTLTSMRYQAHPPSGLSLYATWLFLETNFREFHKAEVRMPDGSGTYSCHRIFIHHHKM